MVRRRLKWFSGIALLTLFALCVAAGAGEGGGDIRGPIGPIEPRPAGFPVRRALAAVLAAGFVLVGVYFILRRRRRRRARRAAPAGPPPPDFEGLVDLPADRFYEQLLAEVRQRVERASGRPTASLTPRELGRRIQSAVGEGRLANSWRALCERAEWALYADADVPAWDRERDAGVAAEVVTLVERPRPEEESRDEP